MIDTGGVREYGQSARRYGTLLHGVPVFIVSDDAIGARDELLEVRRKGADAAVMLLLEEPRADMSRRAAADVYRQIPSYDVRRPYMEAIEHGTLDVHGRKLLELCVYDPTRMAHLRQLLALAGTLVVRSFEDLRRIRAHVGPVRCNVVPWFPERELPSFTPSRGDGIVLWGADDPGELAAIAAFALDQSHREVVIVTASPPGFPTQFRWVSPGDPKIARVLENAACIVDLTADDPSWTYAFTRRGLPVAAASTSGAIEVLEGVATYEPWSFRSIAGALAEALGRGPARIRASSTSSGDVLQGLEASQVVPPAQEPLVSIVIPTYNRRARAESAVQRLCVQQYPDLEIVVVNDGGENVDHLVDFDPRVRVIDAKVNAGPAAAVNIGLREAQGKYVEWVADDDLLYPDHVLRCVAALERTGAVVAHSNALLCASLVNEDGIDTAIYDTDRFSETADLCETYAYHRVARFLVRRTEIVELGGLAEDLFACDLEILIRLAERFDFVHVPAFTSETWLRMGEVQFSTRKDLDHATELEKMFERHPAGGRPYVAALRKKTLENVRGKAGSVRGY